MNIERLISMILRQVTRTVTRRLVNRGVDTGIDLAARRGHERGGDGATAFLHDGREISVSAPAVDVADTVGAGDSFMGGLIYGLKTYDDHQDQGHEPRATRAAARASPAAGRIRSIAASGASRSAAGRR